MRLLFYTRRLTIVSGLPAYAHQWHAGGRLPLLAIRRARKGGGLHLVLFGFCLGIKLR
jgi:hypothetical protein